MIKYNKDLLTKTVKESTSILEVLKKLNTSLSGTMHNYISKKIKLYDINTSHFQQSKNNSGGKKNKKSSKDILTKLPKGKRERSSTLRRALIESGKEYICNVCKINKWLDQPLKLQINHINKDKNNNYIDNLEFLCPSCHYQVTYPNLFL